MKSVRVTVLTLLAACGSVSNDKKMDAAVTPTDTQSVDMQMADAAPDGPPPPRCDKTKAFGAPVAVTELNTTSEDYTPWLTADELEVWFGSTRAGGVGGPDIWRATRASKTAAWGTPTLVAGVNTAGVDQRPTLTSDGLTMYIEYRGTGSADTYKVHVAVRASTSVAFGASTAVTQVNTASNDVAPYVLPDHSAMYLVSSVSGNAQIYRAARVGGVWQAPVLDSTLSSTAGEDYPVPANDELSIYFPSNRTGTLGMNDIWFASRGSKVDAFSTPVNVGAPVNTVNAETPSWVSADQCVMYLYKANGANGTDIFVATRPL